MPATGPFGYEIPDIPCPFPYRSHPEAERAREHLAAWTERHGLLRSEGAAAYFHAARYWLFSAYAYPEAGELTIGTEWMAWEYLFDDQFDENVLDGQAPVARQAVEEVLAHFTPHTDLGPPSGGSRLGLAAAAFWRRVAPLTASSWQRRFVVDVSDFLNAYLTGHASRRTDAPPPDRDTFIRLRRDIGGVLPCLDVIEPAYPLVLPDALTATPAFRALRDSANDVICWTNDVISLDKELARGESLNLVAVLRHEGAGTWSEAARRAVALTARRNDDVERACHALVAVAEEAGGTQGGAERYGRAVRDWIAGSHRWHQANRRFLDVDHDTPPGVRTDRVDELLTFPTPARDAPEVH